MLRTGAAKSWGRVALVGLMLAVSSAFASGNVLAQNIISVPFTDGFIGARGQSAGTANTVLTYATLGIARTFFIQSSSTNTFELQGNDMPGTLRIVRTNGTTLDIPASANWRNSGGSTYLIGILPRPSSPITFTYGGGSIQITDGSSPGGSSVGGYIAAYQGSTLTDGASTSGNAAQSQVLNGLNAYLATVVSSRPAGPVTVTTLTTNNTTPTVTGTANVGASENLTVVVEGVQYSSVTSPAVVRNGTAWSLALSTPLSVGAHEVTATITNVDGFTLSDATSNEVTITSGGGTVTIGGSFTANTKTYTGTTAATGTTTGLTLVGVNSPDVVTIASVTLAFQSAGVANGKTVVITGVTLGGANGASYSVNLTGAPTATANITAASLTISGLTASNKVYDATTNASLTGTAAYSGLVNGESFSVSGTPAAAFVSAGVGAAKSVGVTGYTTPSANYSLTQPSGLTANITARSLTVNGTLLASDKPFDGNTSATLNTAGLSLVGVQGSDVVSLTGIAGAFATSTVGAGKTVSISSASLTGAAAANYSLSLAGAPTATAAITSAGGTVTIGGSFSADNRAYNGTTSATGITSGLTIVGVNAPDVVTIASVTLAFQSSGVANGKTVVITGVVLGGANGAGYTVDLTGAPTATANISAVALGITGVSASNKVYDATTAASLTGTAAYTGLVNGESFSVTGTPAATFNTAGVGTAKLVSVSGYTAPSANYTLTQPSGLTANITARGLTIGGTLLASDKVYDGNTSATLNTSGLLLTTVFGSDVVSLTSVAGTFAAAAVGTGKTVSITSAGLTGTQASNYTLSVAGAPTATAAITSAGGTVTIGGSFSANSKTYDGTTAATGTTNGLTLLGVNSPDVVTIASVTLGFQSAGVGNSKTVVITSVTLGGANGGGYSVDLTGAPTALANISAATLGITGVTASNKTYDASTAASLLGTAAYTGLVNGETFSVSGAPIATFGTADVGNAKPVGVTGYAAPSANYTLVQPAGLTANVAVRTLTIGGALLASNKPFDGNTSASLNTSGLTLVGVQGADAISLTSVVGAFASPAVGAGISVSLSSAALSGTNASNYALSLAGAPSTTAAITALGGTLTIGGSFTATSRVYDGTTSATGNTTGLVLVGVNGADQVTIASATIAFQTASAGVAKTVVLTNVTLGGANMAGYSVNLVGAPTATADITPKALTISGVSAVGKTYDATTAASLSGTAAYVGLVNGETFTVAGSAAVAFSTAAVGTGKSVLVSGYAAPNANYALTQPSGLTAFIATRPLTIGGSFTASNKVFDGTAAATISNNQLVLTNAVGGDAVQLSAVVAAFQNATAGAGKPVTLTSAALSGASASNYALSLAGAPTTTADITSAGGVLTLGGEFTANSKIYDKNTTATGTTIGLTLVGKTPQDQVSIASVTLAFTNANAGKRTVQIVAVTLAGLDAPLFTVNLAGAPTAPASITPKTVDIGGAFTAADKYFDGTTDATITSNTLAVVGKVGNDNVSLGNSVATFADAQVGKNKIVSIGALQLTGADASNYVLNAAAVATTTASILAADPPSVPRNVDLTADDGTITVTWVVPQLSGCSEVNGYVIEHSANGGQSWTRVTVPANPTTATLRGLANNSAHRVRIAATNVCGTSAFATVAEAITPVGPSQTPTTNGPTSTTPRGPEPVTVEVVRDTTLQLTTGSVSLSLQSSDSAGHVIPVDSGHTLELEQGGRAKSEGKGFASGTTVSLYLYPAQGAPILLGKVTVDVAGRFVANVPIPASLTEGDYTLQVSGIDQTQTPRSIAIGVQVNEPPADLELTSTPDQASPAVGDTVIITLTVTNKGTGAATDVVIPRAFREPGFNIIKTTAIDGRYDAATQEWTISRIEPGARARMLLTVIVVPPSNVPAGQAGNQP